jgi:uncharacterized membrane protein
MTQRLLGMTAALAVTDLFFHSSDALAMNLRAETMSGRIGAVMLAVGIIVVAMIGSRLFFPRPFFHGFVVAVGMFLSIDIVLIHWVFQLHRITSGPEANVLEPIFVVLGVAFLVYGIRNERAKPVAAA